MKRDPFKRFAENITPGNFPSEWTGTGMPTPCILWTGTLFGGGYGQFNLGLKKIYAHRWFYEYTIGRVPDGLHLDHLCRVRRCVNPTHLEPVTCQENVLRSSIHKLAAKKNGLKNDGSSRRKYGLPRGVTPSGERYRAQICIHGKKRYLGSFDTPEEAAAHYAFACQERARM